ncbi:CYPRO4 protein [Spatholobus suberectus]|nr:CYPRO4 protein [Spatholobus suberectus]
MGTSQSREGLEVTDSDSDYEQDHEEEEKEEHYEDAQTPSSSHSSELDDVDAKLKALKLKYQTATPSSSAKPQTSLPQNAVKLYLHIGGNTPNAKWILSDKRTSYAFLKDTENDESDGEWVLTVGSKVRARVSSEMQLKMFGDQRRVDFVANGVWALKFPSDDTYRRFVTEFQNCVFENVYGLECTEENKVKIYGKEFIGWVKPEAADDSVWEDAFAGDDNQTPSPAGRETT